MSGQSRSKRRSDMWRFKVLQYGDFSDWTAGLIHAWRHVSPHRPITTRHGVPLPRHRGPERRATRAPGVTLVHPTRSATRLSHGPFARAFHALFPTPPLVASRARTRCSPRDTPRSRARARPRAARRAHHPRAWSSRAPVRSANCGTRAPRLRSI